MAKTPKPAATKPPLRPDQGYSRFTQKAWDAIEVLEKEMASLGATRMVIQSGEKISRAIAYRY